MATIQLYISKVIFKSLELDPKYMSYSYCFEAANDKEAYQKALIIASEQYFILNQNGSYNFVGLQKLTLLNKLGDTKLVEGEFHSEPSIDEYALKCYQDALIKYISIELV